MVSTSQRYLISSYKPTEFYRSIIKTHSLKQSFFSLSSEPLYILSFSLFCLEKTQIKERIKITFTCERHGNLSCIQRNDTSFHFSFPTFLPFSNKVFALREMDRRARPRGRISGRNSESSERFISWSFLLARIRTLDFPMESKIASRIDPRKVYPLFLVWRYTLLVDGFTADLSPRLLGNCLGRGGRAQARVLPAISHAWMGTIDIHLPGSFWRRFVSLDLRYNRAPTSNYDSGKINLSSARSLEEKKRIFRTPARKLYFLLREKINFKSRNPFAL